jgi:TM2 domain-containing membrane protein YozV
MISNPKKELTVNYNILKIKKVLQYISFTLYEENPSINYYTFTANEFLSLGVYIDITLNEKSDNKTEITIEVRRKLGSFDQSYEISKANTYINKILKELSTLLELDETELLKLKKEDKIEDSPSKYSLVKVGLLCLFLGVFGVHRFYTKNYISGFLQFITGGGFLIWWGLDLITIALGLFKDSEGKKINQ